MKNFDNHNEFFNEFVGSEDKQPRTKGTIIVPQIDDFADYLVWKSFESAAEDTVPNALKSGVNCCGIIIAGDDVNFVFNSLQLFLEPAYRAKFISGHAESTTLVPFRGTGNFKRAVKTTFDEISSKYMKTNRFFAVTNTLSDVPDELRAVADGIIDLTSIDERIIFDGIKKFIDPDAEMNMDDLLTAGLSGLQNVALAFKKGRPLAKSIEICKTIKLKPVHENIGLSDGPCLDDLHGLGAAGDWGRDLAQDLEDWQNGVISWSEIDKGVHLSGAPGTGKTTFASALARTCGVNLVHSSLAQWQSHGHLGDLLREMRATFQDAMSKAPCILFIDEFDSAGDRAKFSGHNAHYSTEVVNSLFECIDGSSKLEGVVIVGATNLPEKIDSALRRAGRLDQHIVIPLPDAPARIGILQYHLKGELDGQDLSVIAEELDGASGADIEQLVRQSKRFARRQKRDLQTYDLVAALPPKRTLPRKTIERLAIHEAGHAVLGNEYGYPIVEVKINTSVPLAGFDFFAGGFVEFGAHPTDFMSVNKDISEYTQRILGGMAAEKILLGEHSTGVAADLQNATYYIANMLISAGMGDDLICLTDVSRESVLSALRMRKDLQEKVSHKLDECLKSAENIIQNRRNHVEKLAAALIDKGKLTGAEIKEIFAINERIIVDLDNELGQPMNTKYLH